MSISKCCPLGETINQLGACQKGQADHFLEEVALLVPSSERVEEKVVEARCKEVDGVLIDTRKDTLGSLILEIWDEGYQQTSDFACLDKLEEDDGLVAVLCHSNERKRGWVPVCGEQNQLRDVLPVLSVPTDHLPTKAW